MAKKHVFETAAKKGPAKRLRKEIRTLRRSLKAEKKRVTKAVRTTTARSQSLRKGLDRLKTELEKYSKKKTPKKQLSEYNLFMRRQLLAGKTFATAVRMWKAYRKGKPSVRAKARTVARSRIITRTVVRRIRSKPKIITRTIFRTAPARVDVLPAQKEAVDKEIISGINQTVSKIMQADLHSVHKESKHTTYSQFSISDEELAFKLLTLYFEEVARLGLKRQLQMKDVIVAYYETLEKIRERKAASEAAHAAPENKAAESKHNKDELSSVENTQ